MADIKIRVVPFVSGASTGNVDVTHVDFAGATPKAVIIIGGAEDSDSVEMADILRNIGFAVNGIANSNNSILFSDDAAGTSNASRSHRSNNADIIRVGQVANVNSWIADGVRINFTTNAVGVRRYFAILFGGADVTAWTGAPALGSTLNAITDVNTVGFQPDLVFTHSAIVANTTGTNTSNAMQAFGAAQRTTGENFGILWGEQTGQTTASNPYSIIFNNASYGLAATSNVAPSWTGVIDDFDASGFSLHATGTPASQNIQCLALKFDGASVDIHEITQPVATGNVAVTGVGFKPQVGIFVTAANATINVQDFNVANAAGQGIGAADSSGAFGGHVFRDKFDNDPTVNKNLSPPYPVVSPSSTDADALVANLVSFDVDGYTLDYDAVTGTASKMFVVLISSVELTAEGSIGTVTLTPPEAEASTVTTPRTTQMGIQVLGLEAADVYATQAGLQVLAKEATNVRVTQMGILALARGAAGLIVPDQLGLSDGGRSMVIRQRLVNMYSEPTPQGPSASGRFGRPGLYEAIIRGLGPIRAIFTWKKSARVTVSGDTVYFNDFIVGTLPDPDGMPVRWAVSDDECVIVSGNRAYYVTVYDVTLIENENLLNVIDVKFLAGRFIYTLGDRSGQYFYSDVGDALTVSGTSFISAESNPDPITANAILGDAAIFFGEETVEFHYASTDPAAPYQRSSGRRYDKGSKSPHSIVLCDNTLVFLGSDRKLYRTDSVPILIGNDDFADRARKVTDDDLPDVTAFKVDFGNHEVYVINLPGQGSWGWDFKEKIAYEWRSWNKPRFRVNVADKNVLGDIHSGRLMGLDGQRFQDLDDPLERVCSTFAPLRSGSARNFNIALMAKRGVGLPTGQGSIPVVDMRFSDNQDGDWSDWVPAPLGISGDRSRAAIALWINLGSMIPPGRQFEFRCTDPVEFLPYEVKINEVRP